MNVIFPIFLVDSLQDADIPTLDSLVDAILGKDQFSRNNYFNRICELYVLETKAVSTSNL